MNFTKKKIENSFNRGSIYYDNYNDVQKSACLELVKLFFENTDLINVHFKKIGLDLGSGSGLLSIEISKLLEFKKLHLIDLSEKMLGLAKKKIMIDGVTYEKIDFDQFKNFGRFNFIFSNMSLHWSENFNLLFDKVIQSIKKDAIVLFSVPTSINFSGNFDSVVCKKLINKFPEVESKLKKLDKNKFFVKHSSIVVKEKFNNLLGFFFKLKKVGTNVKLENGREKLIKLRKYKSQVSVSHNISLVLIKKLSDK